MQPQMQPTNNDDAIVSVLTKLNNRRLSVKAATDSKEYPIWWRNAKDARYPDECRALCSGCHGWRTTKQFELLDCDACYAAMGPCSLHACRLCNGSGLVCPGCQGMRFVRKGTGYSNIGGDGGMKPCDTCMEGNNVNSYKEDRAIGDYLATGNNGGRWIKLSPEKLSERRLQRIREQKEAADAYHRDWASVHITAKQHAMERREERLSATSDAIAARGITPLSGPELLRLVPEQGRQPSKAQRQRQRRDGDRR